MKQCILNNARRYAYIGIVALATALVGCSNKTSSFDFKTPQEAVDACRHHLYNIQCLDKADMDKLKEITATWVELQDSVHSLIMRDSTLQPHSGVVMTYYGVADSIRREINRLALSEKRSIADVFALKVATASGRKQQQTSETYKVAKQFYEILDEEAPYPNLPSTMSAYDHLLSHADPFRQEGELYEFIKAEDKCFRSLLLHLREVPQEQLKSITDKTALLFDRLYHNTAADLDNEVNERVMLYLTMRFNRRIIQNAETCRADIKANQPLTEQQSANYRWMIIQPYLTIDNYATAVLTDKQVASLTKIANELPELLAYVDGKDYAHAPKEETDKLTDVLSEYFLKSYLTSIL